MKTIVLISNTSWSVFNFRANLIAALREGGWRVVAAAPHDAYSSRLAGLGAEYQPLAMDNKGRNPLRDAALLGRLVRLLARQRPDCVLSFTTKPNIYASLAARCFGIPVINNIAGLGSVFVRAGPTQWLLRSMYRAALARSRRVFFQNADDHRLFVERGLVSREKAEVLPGSGVDTARFVPMPSAGGEFVFLFLGRLLREKGLPEFVEAARLLRPILPAARFRILGFAGVSNPAAVSPQEVRAWTDAGLVEYLGETDDVRPYLAAASCVVLPSYYREGVPRCLLEAASMERPIITTDTPGCRDAVLDRESGFLVAPRDVPDLVAKMSALARLPAPARETMGRKGRQHMQTRFDERIVIARYLSAVAEVPVAV